MSKKLAIYFSIFIIIAIIICGLSFLCFNLIYPLKYKNEIEQYSQETKIDKYLICGIIKAESSFNKNAVSKVGAIGLMQLKPLTANYVCELYNFNKLENNNYLYNPDVNIKLGTYYFSYLIKKFDGNLKYALIAYNAGESKVKEWILSNNFDSEAYPISLRYYNNVIKYSKIYKRKF